MFILCAVQPGAIRLIKGGHKPGKRGKSGKHREFEKLSKSQGKLGEFELLWKKPGKLRENEKYVT